MRKLFILNTDKEMSYKEEEYLSSSYVFVPINESLNSNIKSETKVLKGQLLNNLDYSYVSGEIKGIKKCKDLTKEINTLAIKNNYKEQRTKKTSNNYLKTNIQNILNSNKDNLILNAFDDDPYIYNSNLIIDKFYHDILNTLDYIKNNSNFKNIYIVAKDINKKNIEKFINVIGNYPDIKFITVPNVYPIYNTNYYEEVLNIKNYESITIYDIYNLYYLNEHKYNYCEKYLTIMVEDKTPIVINVKMGTLVSEILNYLKIKYKEYNIYLNGIIGKIKVYDINNLIVTDKLKAIFLTKSLLPKSIKCLNCGNCIKYCPAKINPKVIFETNSIKEKDYNKCIKCGLCNYICPAYIDLLSNIERIEDETKTAQ